MSIQSVQPTQTYSPAKKAAKTAAKAVATTAAVATALAIGAKKGKFTVNENSSKVAQKVLPYLEKAGNFVNGQVNKATTKLAKLGIKEKVTNSAVYKTVKEKAGKVADKIQKFDIKGKVSAKLYDVKEYFQTNIGKYNPDKAGLQDKMAETFNNFVR